MFSWPKAVETAQSYIWRIFPLNGHEYDIPAFSSVISQISSLSLGFVADFEFSDTATREDSNHNAL